ncbi:hypothetical protein FSARC_2996 [Fusarium sarcochroum]|uniref:Uncharacterized protein n=1 Tax=Fusarium sarcochroum TaxID=1208366 RepID=A0A8H4U4X5_9HYPO|nr:hypothetical protein FSARC_2996 [Fusarium sarcochroum]
MAKELHFDTGIDDDPRRCIHAHDWLGYMDKWVENEPRRRDTWNGSDRNPPLERNQLVRVKYECLAQRAVAMLGRFEDNQLDNFSWNYTTCIPSEVLELLTLKQPTIRGLSFVTDPFCGRFNRWSGTSDVDLSSFRQLRRLSWKAPMGSHFDDTATTILNNAHHLEEIELELQSWSREREVMESRIINREDGSGDWNKTPASTVLARQIFGLQTRTPDSRPRPYYPKIRSLTLTRLPLKDEVTGQEVTAASFNLGILRSLTLRMCPFWMHLLTSFLESGVAPKLKTLEILDFYLQTPHSAAMRKTTVITNFIDSFTGLEELFVSHCGLASALDFWEHVAGHGSTLKRLVHHQRTTDRDEELMSSRMGKDLQDFAMSQMDRDRIIQDPSQNPFSRLDLEFIGLTCAPKYLRDVLLPFVLKSSLKVLHIRHTGVNASPSPSWVFNKALDLKLTEAESSGKSVSHITMPSDERDAKNRKTIAIDPEEITIAIKERKDWKTPPLQHHFRVFADWVFGPEGIRSLEYIAVGDLSRGNRYEKDNALVCRAVEGESRFRVISQRSGGLEWRDIKSRFGNALEACPVENLVPEYN